jgi:hypothetical protein
VLAALHDDGTTVRSAIAVYIRRRRSGPSHRCGRLGLRRRGDAHRAGAGADPVRGAVVTALGSGQISAPVADALRRRAAGAA